MRTKSFRSSALALATVAAGVGLSIATPLPADAVVPTEESAVSLAPESDRSLAVRAIVIGTIETDDCTYTLVLDSDGFHIEVVCVTIS